MLYSRLLKPSSLLNRLVWTRSLREYLLRGGDDDDDDDEEADEEASPPWSGSCGGPSLCSASFSASAAFSASSSSFICSASSTAFNICSISLAFSLSETKGSSSDEPYHVAEFRALFRNAFNFRSANRFCWAILRCNSLSFLFSSFSFSFSNFSFSNFLIRFKVRILSLSSSSFMN